MPDLRVGEVLAALSLVTDLAQDVPLESALRNAVLGVAIGRRHGARAEVLSDTYHLALLRYLGCTASAQVEAAMGQGDDLGMRRIFGVADYADAGQMMRLTLFRFADGHPMKGLRTVAKFAIGGRPLMNAMNASTCEVASRLAARLGSSEGVQRGMYEMFARWDGKVFPPPFGEDISLAARITHVARVVERVHQLGGREAAEAVVRERAGGELDPAVAATFLTASDELLEPLEAGSVWDLALASEPEPHRSIPPSGLEEIAGAFADFVDLKSPYLRRHSTDVAELATEIGRQLGLDAQAIDVLRIAGLLHDLGRVSVPNSIWDKRGPLNAAEVERVRLHAYHTERVLSHSPLLDEYGRIAGMHHERLDGSGYHRAALAASLPLSARVLAAADTYHALIEDRPHRPALVPKQAASTLESEAAAGRLDREVVAATLRAVGLRTRRRGSWPRGLTDREIDVLRELACGRSNREIGERLYISSPTVHTHVLNIYSKISVKSRAGAALFAMEHDLIRS